MLLAAAVLVLNCYRAPYPDTSQTFLHITDDRDPLHFPWGEVPGFHREDLKRDMAEVSRRYRKLVDSVVAGLQALVDMQELSEHVHGVEVWVLSQDEKVEVLKTCEETIMRMGNVLGGIEDKIGYTCPDDYGAGDGGEEGEGEAAE